MIEFAKNAASTRYVIFVNQNCSDHSGAVQRTRAKNCLLAPLTRLNGFVQHELYRHPASMLAHFCCFSSILRARPGRRLRADRPRRRWREGNWPVYFGYIRRLDHSECVHLHLLCAPFGRKHGTRPGAYLDSEQFRSAPSRPLPPI